MRHNEFYQRLVELDEPVKKTAKKKKKVNIKYSNNPAVGRKPANPDVTYKEVPLKKKDPGVIDSVVAFLSGKTSERYTKLARRFAQIKRIKEYLAKEEKKLNVNIKSAVEELFDAGDDVYTRVVDTATMVFKLSKKAQTSNEKFDVKAYLVEVEKLTGLAEDELNKIRKRYTTIVKGTQASKLLTPKEKGSSTKTTESAGGKGNKLKTYAHNIAMDTQEFLKSWDQQFAALEAKIDAI